MCHLRMAVSGPHTVCLMHGTAFSVSGSMPVAGGRHVVFTDTYHYHDPLFCVLFLCTVLPSVARLNFIVTPNEGVKWEKSVENGGLNWTEVICQHFTNCLHKHNCVSIYWGEDNSIFSCWCSLVTKRCLFCPHVPCKEWTLPGHVCFEKPTGGFCEDIGNLILKCRL